MIVPSRDSFIMEALDRARPMLLNMVRTTPLDVEDLKQEAALALLTAYERIQTVDQPQWYALRVIQNAALQYLRRERFTVSLDEPRGDDEDNSTTLADTLAAPDDQPQDFTASDRRAAALHDALRRLPLDEQQFIRERYALNAFNPLPHYTSDGTICQPQHERKRGTISSAAYRHLRADGELLIAALEVQ